VSWLWKLVCTDPYQPYGSGSFGPGRNFHVMKTHTVTDYFMHPAHKLDRPRTFTQTEMLCGCVKEDLYITLECWLANLASRQTRALLSKHVTARHRISHASIFHWLGFKFTAVSSTIGLRVDLLNSNSFLIHNKFLFGICEKKSSNKLKNNVTGQGRQKAVKRKEAWKNKGRSGGWVLAGTEIYNFYAVQLLSERLRSM